jgi:MarR family 2-MHQ and catechol resistance regulon transcriptional repressor
MPTHHKGTAIEVRALNAFIKLTRATESLMSRLFRRGTADPLTISQFGVMETLYHLGPLCQGELSGKLLRSGGNITLVIDNLEKQGLVRRERDLEDRRLVRVSLTSKGTELISEIFPKHIASIVEEMQALTPEEQEQLGELCKKLGKGECQSKDDGGI